MMQSKYVINCTIDSKKHHLETKEQYKIAIDPLYDKGIKGCNGEFRFYVSISVKLLRR